MEHARDIELIELAAGRLDAGRKEAVLGHLQQCVLCREKLEGIRGTWDVLGAWEVHAPERLGPAAPVPAFEPRREAGRRPTVRLFHLRTALRFAAAIVVTVLLGYTSGRWSSRRGSAAGEPESPQYISVLGLDVGGGLSTLVLDDEPSPAEEERT